MGHVVCFRVTGEAWGPIRSPAAYLAQPPVPLPAVLAKLAEGLTDEADDAILGAGWHGG